jgi:hypothetical protein
VKQGARGRLENAEGANREAISVGAGFSAVRKEMGTLDRLARKSLLAHAYRRDTVLREIGPGSFEAICKEASEMALRERGIPFEARKSFVG